MDNTELIKSLNKELQMNLPELISQDEMIKRLSQMINHLIKTDFQKLVFILYKTDVSENKLKLLLQQNSNADAAPVIAKLIVERQLQKINFRGSLGKRNDMSDEEKW